MGSGRRCPSAVRGADTAAIGQAQTPPRSPALAPPTRPWNARPLDPPPPSARHPLAWSTLPLPARTTQSSSLPSRRKPFSLCEVSLHRSAHSASGPRPPGPRTLVPPRVAALPVLAPPYPGKHLLPLTKFTCIAPVSPRIRSRFHTHLAQHRPLLLASFARAAPAAGGRSQQRPGLSLRRLPAGLNFHRRQLLPPAPAPRSNGRPRAGDGLLFRAHSASAAESPPLPAGA